ncbi:dTDP-4-dehydrorhamnose reductase [Xylanibacter oryzae]|uniref:dTDP-4-dehydrorhamnose reductase n=1 Tax=Xylanibacter oryzae TaxID=185293 RepID=UPI0004B19CD3|nr:dTDP-4-dehydrorhamnose reductase [Xylanibacter oryzae]
MNILITGCNGQLGNEMQLLEEKNPQHTFFNTDVSELDITDQSAINEFVNSNKIDGIVNCAAYTAVDKAESNKQLCQLLNTEAPGFLAEAIEKRHGWIIQISTDYVFDGTKHTPYVETDRPCPNSVYGSTKLLGETEVVNHCKNAMIIRTAWLYSIYGNNFVKTMIRLGKEKSQLGVIFDQIGTPTYAGDLANVIMVAINKGVYPGVYHFSNEGVISWFDFTKAIHRIAGIKSCNVKPLHTKEYPTPAARPAYSVLDKTKIKETYGIEIPYWEDSLKECVERLKQ